MKRGLIFVSIIVILFAFFLYFSDNVKADIAPGVCVGTISPGECCSSADCGPNELCSISDPGACPNCNGVCQQTGGGPVCGNNIPELGEECDLGIQNGQQFSRCSSSCQWKG